MPAPSFQKGFTAVEVMVVVAILAILAAVAAPAMNKLIRTQKVRGASYDLFSDLTYARGEAIARGHNVLVSTAGGNAWETGWTIRDTTSGEMLRTQNVLSSGLSVAGDAGSLTFDRSGRTTVTIRWTILPTDSGVVDTDKRCVRISPSGRPNATTGACP